MQKGLIIGVLKVFLSFIMSIRKENYPNIFHFIENGLTTSTHAEHTVY